MIAGISHLIADMKSVFGENFGDKKPGAQSMTEAVEASVVAERNQFRGANKLHQRHAKEVQDRGEKNMHDFRHHASREMERSGAEKADRDIASIRRDASDHDKSDDKSKRPFRHALRTMAGVSSGGSEGQDASDKPHSARGGASSRGGGGARHNPFKRGGNLGLGPGTPSGFTGTGPRHHDQKKCWSCHCGNIYKAGCTCVGTGKSEDCPYGHIKHVHIKKDYRKAYNDMYHEWRRKKHGAVTARVASGR